MSDIQENHKVLEEQEGRFIRQTIADMESAFNQHDADALDRHFTQDSTWVNVMGEMLSGWEQINNAHKVVLKGPLLHSYAKYFVEKLVFLRQDVAIAHIRQYPATSKGELIEDGQGSLAIYVMVKDQDTWLLVAGQNTLIQSHRKG